MSAPHIDVDKVAAGCGHTGRASCLFQSSEGGGEVESGIVYVGTLYYVRFLLEHSGARRLSAAHAARRFSSITTPFVKPPLVALIRLLALGAVSATKRCCIMHHDFTDKGVLTVLRVLA